MCIGSGANSEISAFFRGGGSVFFWGNLREIYEKFSKGGFLFENSIILMYFLRYIVVGLSS